MCICSSPLVCNYLGNALRIEIKLLTLCARFVMFSNAINFNRQGPLLRAQIQQPLNVEMLTQQQQLQQQINSNNSPKRDGRTLLSQNIIHQSYGVAQQGGSSVSGNVIAPGSCLIGTGIPVSGNTMASTGAVRQRPLIPPGGPAGNAPPFIQGNPNISGMLPQHLPMAYYSQAAPAQSYFGEVLHPMQVHISHSRRGIAQPNIMKMKMKISFTHLSRCHRLRQSHDSLQQSAFRDSHRRFSDNCVKRRNSSKTRAHNCMQPDMEAPDRRYGRNSEAIDDPP